MKFKLNRGKSIKLGDKEIPISTTDGWTDIPDDEIIEALSNAGQKHGQPDWSKEDETDPGYIKNRPGSELIYSQSGLIDLSAIEPGKAIKISNWNAWLYGNYKDLFYADTLKDGLAADKYEGPFYKWKAKFTFVSTGKDIGFSSWSYSSYSRIERIDSINYMIHVFDSLYIVVVFDYSVLPTEYSNEIKSNGFFGYMKEEGSSYPSSFNNWNAEIIFGYTRPMNAAAVVPSVKQYFQRKEIQDTANYFSTKTVEGALDQIGEQLDKYFGYTVDENSVANGILTGSNTAEISGFYPQRDQTYLIEFGNQEKFLIGSPYADGYPSAFGFSFYTGYDIESSSTDAGVTQFKFRSPAPTLMSSTAGEIAFKIYKVTMDPDGRRFLFNRLGMALPFGTEIDSDDMRYPVFADGNNVYALNRNLRVCSYISTPLKDICRIMTGAQVIYLQNVPSSVTTATDYEKLNLTSNDYPITVTCTATEYGHSPNASYRIATASGRVIGLYHTLINGNVSVTEHSPSSVTISSSTEGSSKKFRITVDDTGTLSATEVTD